MLDKACGVDVHKDLLVASVLDEVSRRPESSAIA